MKCRQAKSKTLFNTVLQMQAGQDATDSKPKQLQLAQAKSMLLGIFIEAYGQALKTSDAQKILDESMKTVQEQALVLIEAGQRFKRNAEAESEESEQEEVDMAPRNEEMKSFLQNIDLLEQT